MDITAGVRAGGLVGYFEAANYVDGGTYNTTITDSFYAGTLSGGSGTGIIVGIYEDFEEEFSSLVFDNVWYDAHKVESYDCVSNLSVDECNAANADGSQPNYFFNNTTNAPIDEWNFETLWKTQAGTPPVFKPFVGNDGDQDGANDYIEDRAPNEGDGNNDGTVDSEQSNVASFVNPEIDEYITLVVDEECSVTGVSVQKAADATQQDSEYNYESGLVNFSTDCGEEGYTTDVTLYHFGLQKQGLTVRKYNPNTETYFTISNASLTDQVIDGQNVAVVSYQITDGGDLDMDDEVNAAIVDPVGLGSTLQSSTSNGSNSDLSDTGAPMYGVAIVALLLIAGSITSRKIQTRDNSNKAS